LKINRWGRWGLVVLAGLTLFVVTFQIGKLTPLEAPSFRRMIERLDMYLAIINEENGVEFLQQLAEKHVFLPLTDHPITEKQCPQDDELYRLLFHRNLERLKAMTPNEVEHVVALHRAIEESPQRMELLLTLQNYSCWHRSLQSYDRLASSPPKPLEEKVADIIKLKTRRYEFQPEDTDFMFSEIVGTATSKLLAETLAKQPPRQKDDLLNEEPIVLIYQLEQRSHEKE
jgi:hypothetical protein